MVRLAVVTKSPPPKYLNKYAKTFVSLIKKFHKMESL